MIRLNIIVRILTCARQVKVNSIKLLGLYMDNQQPSKSLNCAIAQQADEQQLQWHAHLLGWLNVANVHRWNCIKILKCWEKHLSIIPETYAKLKLSTDPKWELNYNSLKFHRCVCKKCFSPGSKFHLTLRKFKKNQIVNVFYLNEKFEVIS